MSLDCHKLYRNWKIYLHYPLYTSATATYGSTAYAAMFDFNTVEEFWMYYNCLPEPSAVFANEDRPRVKLGGRAIEGFGIFQEGVDPEWEKTPGGGHWEISGIRDPLMLDTVWEILCLTLVGETMCKAEHVTGIRVVDKSKAKKPLYRVEIWTDNQTETTKSEVMERITTAFADGGCACQDLPCTWKNHPACTK